MDDVDKSYTSVLLPDSYVTLFTNDADTKKTFQAIEDDWRFARVKLEVHDGSVEEATKYYSEYESPDLVIIQIDEIKDSFTEQLESLSGQCKEGTSAIVVGPVNDVNLYRNLIGMGVSDYLVKPLEQGTFSNDIAASLLNDLGEAGSRLISVIGSKGGVGTSFIAETIAKGVSTELRQKTFLMDGSGGWSTLSVGMNFEPSATLHEAVKAATTNNEDALFRMIHEVSDKLAVLSSGADSMLDDMVDAEGYEALIEHLLRTYPVLIIDLSAAPADVKRIVLKRSHEVLMITSPLLTSVRAARTLLNEIKDIRGSSLDKVKLLVNMRGQIAKHEVPKAQIEEGLEKDVDLEIKYDPALFVASENDAKYLGDDKVGAPISTQLLSFVREVLGEKLATTFDAASEKKSSETSVKEGGLFAGLLSKLKKEE